MPDIFEPSNEPARSIYLAFRAESAKRKGRSLDEWISAERKAVHDACVKAAATYGLPAPLLEQVAAAERYAMGSADYGAKWAYQLARGMTSVPLEAG